MVVVVVVVVRVAVAHGGPTTQRVRSVPTGAKEKWGYHLVLQHVILAQGPC